MSTATNVSVGKPKIGGAIYVAPAGTNLPTDATTALANTFTSLGYVSEDGVKNSLTQESDAYKAWGGDSVLALMGGKEDTFKLTLIESLNVDVLKTVFGASNVTGTLSTGIAVSVNNAAAVSMVWVIEMVLRDNAVKRIVIPSGAVYELGDIVYRDDTPVGYELTVLASPNTSGVSHYEYIKRPTTTTGST